MLGLETALGVAWRSSTCRSDVLAALSWRPAAIAGVADRHGQPIEAGSPANLVVVDPDVRWQVRPAALASRSRNTPYAGMDLRGGSATPCSGRARSSSTARRNDDA